MTIITNLTIEAYHEHEAITNSKLKVFRECPLKYKRYFLDHADEKERTKALDEGAGFDCLLFDGDDEFSRKFALKPDTYPGEKGESKWNGNANYCKAWSAARDAEGKIVLDSDAWSKFVLMRQAIQQHPAAMAIINQSVSQLTFRLNSAKFGFEVQTRPDLFSKDPISRPEFGLDSQGLPFFCDLKTTANFSDWFDPIDPTDHRAGSPVYKFGYHRQAGLCQWVAHKDLGKSHHFLMVVEKAEPYRVGIIELGADYLNLGWDAVEADLKNLAACRLTKIWPGSPQSVIKLQPPQWLLDKSAREAMAAT